ncbi:phospholipase A and acyltransferase 1 isoform X1 [Dunckerocampus dactyliophorus]|uniref:phospholipase A and acyltransferase 1 isoform X1 n=1 Tax=Dunckerocampus dactyliophorus TaxID=161453 RepID=UPI0024051D25|nr:phospholipase A and acyltransferase 1 isoform X1 [Dunckerocampus dactyliophorus]
MPHTCAVLACGNRSNRNYGKSYYRVPKIIYHKGKKVEETTQKRRDRWLLNLSLSSSGAESVHARVCSDHFVKGKPSALYDVENEDWAPTQNLGRKKVKEKATPPKPRSKRTELREEKRRRTEGAEALLVLRNQSEPEAADVVESILDQDEDPEESRGADNASRGCQTHLTMAEIERMEDGLKDMAIQLIALRKNTLDAHFTQEAFEENADKTKSDAGFPNFFDLMQMFEEKLL